MNKTYFFFFDFLSPNFFCRILILLFYLIIRKEQINISYGFVKTICYNLHILYIYIIYNIYAYYNTIILLYIDI